MRDSSQHDDSAGATLQPVGGLTERLSARGVGNVGVIDVRQAQRQFDHLNDWGATRLSVLGTLSARYGTAESRTASSGSPLPIVSGRFSTERFEAPDVEASTGATSEKTQGATDDRPPTMRVEARASEISAPPTSAGGTQGASTIQRKPAPQTRGTDRTRTQSQPGATRESASSVAEKHSSHEAPRASTSSGAPPVQESASIVQPQTESGGSAAHLLQRRRSNEPRIAETMRSAQTGRSVESRGATELNTTLEHATLEYATRVNAGTESKTSASAVSSQTVGAESGRTRESETKRLPSSNESPPSSDEPRESLVPLTLQRVSAEGSSRADELRGGGARDARGAESPNASQSPNVSSLPLAVAQTSSQRPRQTILRMTQAGGATHKSKGVTSSPSHTFETSDATMVETSHANAPSVVSSEETAERAARKTERVSAQEIPQSPPRLSAATMIWRKRDGSTPTNGAGFGRSVHTSLTQSPPSINAGGSSQTLYRFGATDLASRPSMPETVSETETADAPAQSNAGAVNLEEITEHVSRAILRRLAVERERRGIRRWL
jgi:hypothetical protein